MGGNNQKDFVVEIYCNYNKECQTVNSEIKNLYELSHTFFRLGDGYQRFWCFNKVPWWPCLPPKIDLSRGRQEMVYSWSCWCWREDPVMLGLCQAGGHRIPSLNLTRNFETHQLWGVWYGLIPLALTAWVTPRPSSSRIFSSPSTVVASFWAFPMWNSL